MTWMQATPINKSVRIYLAKGGSAFENQRYPRAINNRMQMMRMQAAQMNANKKISGYPRLKISVIRVLKNRTRMPRMQAVPMNAVKKICGYPRLKISVIRVP
jgi:hypothetical protein